MVDRWREFYRTGDEDEYLQLPADKVYKAYENLRRDRKIAELKSVTGWAIHKEVYADATAEDIDAIIKAVQAGHINPKTIVSEIEKDNEVSEFIEINLLVPVDLADKISRGLADEPEHDELMDLVEAELPTAARLYVGLEYSYGSGATYRVEQIGNEEVVLRRMTGNIRGDKGTKLIEKRSKVVSDLLSGRASEVVIEEEDAD